ncbi:hypothetical protein Cco03nite_47590 [Catellatospora coxensis]|uniref:Uncharacterized protein n=1 Tax=Catellatospora coxensis TaxID=310354 RepID=A0A8J3P917_9ACTN|nr:hypothetical protein Cco03nite_47590 [Catellatospora coxensis]
MAAELYRRHVGLRQAVAEAACRDDPGQCVEDVAEPVQQGSVSDEYGIYRSHLLDSGPDIGVDLADMPSRAHVR